MSPRLLPLKRSISVMSLFPSARKRTPTSLMRRAFLMTVRALILVRLAPRHDPFESRPLKPFIPVADLNRSWDEAGTQGLSRAATPGPGFWLRGVDRYSSSARLGSLLAIHRGNRPLQRPRLFGSWAEIGKAPLTRKPNRPVHKELERRAAPSITILGP